MMEPGTKCCEQVWDEWSQHRCPRNATIERDGKPYCKQHDPKAVKARYAKRQAKWDAEAKANQERYDRSEAERKACAGVPTEQLRPGLLKELLAVKGGAKCEVKPGKLGPIVDDEEGAK